ncbi:hypothetical protein [Synechococcus sp. PCC 6312]|uniref:hypothetical protein n=1 Tax=Synechococcus sp. (strain ATCC 27167 / PCC 6312) TaxID=195253 RepID=UPI00029F1C7C|nr:hypothetical protein [Synechococcus sp. PCC 6312]AFY62087.1 hypothetical protein Syn6312_3033 [Synechococcus sp. PCC 6312]
MAATKDRGSKMLILWGTVKKKVDGAKKDVKAFSYVDRLAATACGLAEATADEAVAGGLKVATDSKGRQYLAGNSKPVTVGHKVIRCWTGVTKKNKKNQDIKVWRQLKVPYGISAADCFNKFNDSKKVKEFRWPNGKLYKI